MNRSSDILNGIKNYITEAAERFGGKKRSELKNSDFLFPETKSFPIVTPADVPDAISNFGRMKGKMDYTSFLRKLYNMCKRKGPEFVAALPEASKEQLGLKKKVSKGEDGDFTKIEEQEIESPEVELMEYKYDFYEMSLGSIKSIAMHAQNIINAIDNPSVKEGLTESWLQGKIAVTEDYMLTIHNFLMFGESETDTQGAEAAKNLPGLWENIRKKKERMGKNYKPAKPGDKDRPDSDQWKKLTK